MDKATLVKIAGRLTDTRTKIITHQPFFGRLLMHLNFGFANCSTACTDMERILFDPEFANRLNDEELEFVLMHELMHCVLKHCTRGNGKIAYIYNVACDIVVNSIILDSMCKADMLIDGSPLMHLAPNGKEGRLYSAEDVYHMLMQNDDEDIQNMLDQSFSDSHEKWEKLPSDSILEEVWNNNIIKAANDSGMSSEGLSEHIKRIIEQTARKQKVDWRQLLREYIQFDTHDYSFTRPDKRYDGDFLLPSFWVNEEFGNIKNIWIPIDTSGSISSSQLSEALFEITDAIEQVGNIEGNISFFDDSITEPVPFESVEDVKNMSASGGGGTSFDVIFKKMPEFFSDNLPELVIVMTDGMADYPKEEVALGVNVIWVILENELTAKLGDKLNAPWGITVRINNIENK